MSDTRYDSSSSAALELGSVLVSSMSSGCMVSNPSMVVERRSVASQIGEGFSGSLDGSLSPVMIDGSAQTDDDCCGGSNVSFIAESGAVGSVCAEREMLLSRVALGEMTVRILNENNNRLMGEVTQIERELEKYKADLFLLESQLTNLQSRYDLLNKRYNDHICQCDDRNE